MKRHEIKTIKNPDKLSSYWLSQPWLVLFISVSGIVYNIGMLVFPYFLGKLIDGINDFYNGDSNIENIFVLVGIFVLSIFIVQLARAIKRYTVRRFANNTTSSMRLIICNTILHFDKETLDNVGIGNLLTRAVFDVSQAVEGMRKFTTELFDTGILFIVYFVYLILFDYKTSLIAFIPIAIAILISFLMRKEIFKATSESRKVSSKLSTSTYDLFDNAITYRIFGRDNDNLNDYNKTLGDYEKKTVKSSILSDTMMPIANLIALIGLIPVIIFGANHVINNDSTSFSFLTSSNTWTIGVLSTYISTFILLATKSSHTAKLFGAVQKGLASWKRIKPNISDYTLYKSSIRINGIELIISNLSICINGNTLFSNLNLNAKMGEIIGITGPIASGKSAFLKTFLKDIGYSGSINLFGKEIRDYKQEEIYGTIDYMGHKNELFTDTIKENITLGDKTKKVEDFINDAGFNKDLENMPDKEYTIVGNEGVKLSGGQQERISLTRTLYYQKPLIILDDPFASLDNNTEKEVFASLKKYAKDSIIIISSHRLSFFKELDQIIVINNDKSISIGKHEDLLKSSKTYKELFSLQDVGEEAKNE